MVDVFRRPELVPAIVEDYDRDRGGHPLAAARRHPRGGRSAGARRGHHGRHGPLSRRRVPPARLGRLTDVSKAASIPGNGWRARSRTRAGSSRSVATAPGSRATMPSTISMCSSRPIGSTSSRSRRRSEVVLVRQFRHGIRDCTLEIPGGMVDRRGCSRRSLAARREMIEESGYDSDRSRFARDRSIRIPRFRTIAVIRSSPTTSSDGTSLTSTPPKKPRSCWSLWRAFPISFAPARSPTRWSSWRFTGWRLAADLCERDRSGDLAERTTAGVGVRRRRLQRERETRARVPARSRRSSVPPISVARRDEIESPMPAPGARRSRS